MSKLNNQIQSKKPERIRVINYPWGEILKEIDFLSLKVLEHIYFKDRLTLHSLVRSLSKYNRSDRTIRNRVTKLKDWGLIEVVENTNPLCIVKQVGMEKQIKKLIIAGYGRLGVTKL